MIPILALALLLSGCAVATAAPRARTEPPALCRNRLDLTPPAPYTACSALITRQAAIESARTEPGGTMTLTADYCGQTATGYDLGTPVTADAQGYHTWDWQAPVPLSIQCSTATLAIMFTDAQGRSHGTDSALYTLLP
jgi:hypothetical protein